VERAGANIVGRGTELAALRAFVDGPDRTLVLAGGPGIGKTTLWEAGLAAARELGARVLAARTSGAEARPPFAGLIDLLDGVGGDELAQLPPPQRRALEVALLRAEPTAAPPEPGAIAVALLNALRGLAGRREPILVAVDDVQWLDSPSAEALAFAARRLAPDSARFLLARRPGPATPPERALEREGLRRLEIAPLSLGATRRLLVERLGLTLPRRLLRQLVEATLGNPLFALEVGRTIAERGPPALGEPLPVPETVEELLGTRVARLPTRLRKVLLAVASSSELRLAEMRVLAGDAAVDDALDAGLLLVDGGRVRASHPLVAAAARTHARPRERRQLHRELAAVVGDDLLRARHLALATEEPDGDLAVELARAAAAAFARGARRDAVEFGQHALRLSETAGRTEALLELAGYLQVAGELQQLSELLEPELTSLPAGPARARTHLLLSCAVTGRNDERLRHLEQALAESAQDRELRTTLLAELAVNRAVTVVSRIRESEARAREALALAAGGPPGVRRHALYVLAWTLALQGRPIDDLRSRFRDVADDRHPIVGSPERIAGQRLVWRGEIPAARSLFARLSSLADEWGEAVSYALVRLHRCELALRVGEWDEASSLLDEWGQTQDDELLLPPMHGRCLALLAAGRGHLGETDRLTAQVIGRAAAAGVGWDLLEARRARGIASLLAHEPARAAESLRAVWEHAQREGIDEPGVFPVAPELVEALVDLGELDEARAVAGRLRRLAERQEHPWGLAGASRCDGLVALAERADEDAAITALEQAAAAYGELGLRFDRARTLVLLGRGQRRRRRWAAARRGLEDAAAAFDELGSPGWAADARAELERVGARRPAKAGRLTPAEERVVELAVEGLSNKEIAHALVVAINTVEVHLSHAYAKLGVRSRAQLARLRAAKH